VHRHRSAAAERAVEEREQRPAEDVDQAHAQSEAR
jgi:hypothetical protein